jgi:hypothetical protein
VNACTPREAKTAGYDGRAFSFKDWDGVVVDEDGNKEKSDQEAVKPHVMRAVIAGKIICDAELMAWIDSLNKFATENDVPGDTVFFAEPGADKVWGSRMTPGDLVSLFYCF